ncbi:sorting nexin-8 isoform X10 [Canis lupus baileyi]|uniref:sorting nexin-8 isoform X10 n=1 Tax=Canis lupus baileyi TaxID=143281 RepID=UPI003B96D9C6
MAFHTFHLVRKLSAICLLVFSGVTSELCSSSWLLHTGPHLLCMPGRFPCFLCSSHHSSPAAFLGVQSSEFTELSHREAEAQRSHHWARTGERDSHAGLPTPQISERRDPYPNRMQMPQGNPLLLSYTLQELLARDTVQVELIPEKKGLFLKHVEYEVSSQGGRSAQGVKGSACWCLSLGRSLGHSFCPGPRSPEVPQHRDMPGFMRFQSSVYRRYNDFVVFHEMLLHRFPYRMVPALPPKRVLGADREFIESRRRALRRFINLVARHPPFSEDVALRLFLSFSGPDVQNKLKESTQCVGDEFMNCKLAPRAKDFLPADIQTQFAVSRELIRNIYNSFYKLRDRAERIASRAIDNAADLLVFGKELSALGSDTTPLPSWAALNSSTWGSLKQALKGLSVEFALLADKAAQQGKQEENDVVEKLNLFLDLLQSYKDLCERHEKGVLHKHQRALHKYSLMKRQMMSAAVQSREPDSVEQLESRIVEQENAIQTMELRSYFSLYCLHQEMQLVHVYLPLTSHILGAFVNSQIQGHKEMSKVWNDLKPKLNCLFAGPNSSLTLPRSPQDGVSPH